VASDGDDETVLDGLSRAKVDADLINTLDGNNVTQKEHGLLIQIHNRAGLFAMAPGPLAY